LARLLSKCDDISDGIFNDIHDDPYNNNVYDLYDDIYDGVHHNLALYYHNGKP